MRPLEPEMARILKKRIEKQIRKARYFPAECMDESAVAHEVLRPYLGPQGLDGLKVVVEEPA